MARRPALPDVMTIQFMLLAQFGGRPMIPLDEVRQHFFPHLNMPQLMRKIDGGNISLPICRMEPSKKAAKMVLVSHLAMYLKRISDVAEHEASLLAGWKPLKDGT